MPFTLATFDLTTGSRNNNSVTSYQYSTPDTEVTVISPSYFNDLRGRLRLGDVITVYSSTDNKTLFLQVNAITPNIETIDISHASGDGDVVGPASSLNNEVVVFNGLTGKIIKRSNALLVDVTTPTFFNGCVLFMNTNGNGITVDDFFFYDPTLKSFQVGGGNNPTGINSACVGGFGNNAQASFSATLGGAAHLVANNATRSVAIGGLQANIEAINCASLGGNNNQILVNSDGSLIGGGGNNTITNSPVSSILSSAGSSITSCSNANIIGGNAQVISSGADYSMICGGDSNFIAANAVGAFILGGQGNAVRSPFGCAGGETADVSTTADNSFAYGEVIEIKGTHSVSFGRNNTHAAGSNYSSSIGFLCNTAGAYSHAKGRRAKAVNTGAHVLSDGQDADFSSAIDHSLNMRFSGGTYSQSPFLHVNNYAVHPVAFVLSKNPANPGGFIFDASLGVAGAALNNGEMEFVGQVGYVDWIWKEEVTGNVYSKKVYVSKNFSAISGAPQQLIPNNVLTQIRFDTLEVNNDPDYNTGTFSHTPTEAGTWQYVLDFAFAAPAGGNVVAMVHIYKNGAAAKSKNYNILTGEFGSPPSITFLTEMDGNIDTVDCRVQFIGNGGADLLINNAPTGCTFVGNRIGD